MTNKCKYHLIFTSYTRGDEKGKLSGFRTKTHKLCIIISEAQLLRYKHQITSALWQRHLMNVTGQVALKNATFFKVEIKRVRMLTNLFVQILFFILA